MDRALKGAAIGAAVISVVLLPACQRNVPPFEITDAKTCLEISADRTPVTVVSEFSPQTNQVHCWFAWQNAKRDLKLTARWYNTSEGLHILDFPLTLTRRSDQGAVSLKMPQGRSLPVGAYRVDFSLDSVLGPKVVKSVPFTVQSPPPTPPD